MCIERTQKTSIDKIPNSIESWITYLDILIKGIYQSKCLEKERENGFKMRLVNWSIRNNKKRLFLKFHPYFSYACNLNSVHFGVLRFRTWTSSSLWLLDCSLSYILLIDHFFSKQKISMARKRLIQLPCFWKSEDQE